ncbi:MAG TPA: hypothetical protein VIZ31_07215 [Vicinamibacteria bacterium]
MARREGIDIGAPGHHLGLRPGELRHDLRQRREQGRRLAAESLAVAPQRPAEQGVQQRLPGPRVIHDRGVHLEDRGPPVLRRRAHAFPAKVVVALEDRVGTGAREQLADRSFGAEAKEVVVGAVADAVEGGARDPLLARGAFFRVHHGVHLVAPGGQSPRHLEHVDAAPRATGHVLVGGHVQQPHAAFSRTYSMWPIMTSCT